MVRQHGGEYLMALIPPYMAAILVSILKPLLMAAGAIFILLLLVLRVGHRLPNRVSSWIQNKLLRKATALGGKVQGLVQDSDGVVKLYPAEYDPDNSGYWINMGGKGWKFFSSEAEGGGPKWFYGSNVVLAYDGLGGVADLQSAAIGSAAKAKRRIDERSSGRKLYDHARQRLREVSERVGADIEVLPDGGAPDYLTEYTALIPERAVVDLRDTLHNAPFHVRPAQFHRVEENAKAGQSTGLNENLIRIGLLITGFMLAIIAVVVVGGGGGGGGGAVASLPMGG